MLFIRYVRPFHISRRSVYILYMVNLSVFFVLFLSVFVCKQNKRKLIKKTQQPAFLNCLIDILFSYMFAVIVSRAFISFYDQCTFTGIIVFKGRTVISFIETIE